MSEELKTPSDIVYAIKGAGAPVSITVKPEQSVILYKRKLGPDGTNGQWAPISNVIESSEQTVGDILNSGDVIEYGIYNKFANLNLDPDRTPIISRTVCCLKSPSEGHIGITDLHIERGGTFAELFGSTGARQTFLRAYVKPGPVAPWPTGVPLPNTEYQIFDDFNQPHRVMMYPLAADTDYMCAILAMDSVGNYSWEQRTFRTKQRQYKIHFDKITVKDDGDADVGAFPPIIVGAPVFPNPGEMEFRIVVYKVDNGPEPAWTTMAGHTVLDDLKYGDDDHRLILGTGAEYPLRIDKEYGPSNGNTGDFTIAINAHGREFDSSSDELASTGNVIEMFKPIYLDTPTGVREEVTDQDVVLEAHKADDIQGWSFAFDVNVKVSINYR